MSSRSRAHVSRSPCPALRAAGSVQVILLLQTSDCKPNCTPICSHQVRAVRQSSLAFPCRAGNVPFLAMRERSHVLAIRTINFGACEVAKRSDAGAQSLWAARWAAGRHLRAVLAPATSAAGLAVIASCIRWRRGARRASKPSSAPSRWPAMLQDDSSGGSEDLPSNGGSRPLPLAAAAAQRLSGSGGSAGCPRPPLRQLAAPPATHPALPRKQSSVGWRCLVPATLRARSPCSCAPSS